MKINQQRAIRVFNTYISRYNCKDSMVTLKIEHTLNVANLSKRIAAKT